MIAVQGLKKIYKGNGRTVVALENIDLTINKGEIFGIIGASGAGKSTLIRCFNMLEKPTSGTIFIDGSEVTALKAAALREKRREIGMIFQHFNLLSARTVYQNVAYPLEISAMKKDDIDTRVKELLALVGLTEQAKQYPAQLSGGQKQRVGIARAIANNPQVLLSDEATSALDPKTTLSILSLLKDINKKLGLTMVLITHELEVVKTICDRVAVIDSGNIVELGSVMQIFSEPKSPITQEFVKQIVNFEVTEEVLAEIAGVCGASYKLLRLSFIGENAGAPVISNLIKQFDVNVNILHGQIDRIQATPYGTLIISIDGEAANLTKSLAYLKDNDVRIEVLIDAS